MISILVIEDLVMAGYLSLIAVLVSGVGLAQGVVTLMLALGGVTALIVKEGGTWSATTCSAVRTRRSCSRCWASRSSWRGSPRRSASAAVGAFLVGLTLSGLSADRASDMLGPMRDVFAAIFFAFFGLSIDPSTIPPILGAAALLAIATGATKVATGCGGAHGARVRTRGRFRAGAALSRAASSRIAIAGIGVSGVEPEIASLASAYVLITAVAGPVVARVIDPIVQAVQSRSSVA